MTNETSQESILSLTNLTTWTLQNRAQCKPISIIMALCSLRCRYWDELVGEKSVGNFASAKSQDRSKQQLTPTISIVNSETASRPFYPSVLLECLREVKYLVPKFDPCQRNSRKNTEKKTFTKNTETQYLPWRASTSMTFAADGRYMNGILEVAVSI